jgi:uncharacterized protein YggE
MKKIIIILSLTAFSHVFIYGQEAGNRAYGTQKRVPQASSGILTGTVDGKNQVYFVEANVMANMKPDAFVAVFGLVQEGLTAAASNEKVNAQLSGFIADMKSVGIDTDAVFVDFITQNKIYDFTTEGSTVTEKFSGFETKKNIAVRYKSRDLLEKLLTAAARRSIFDLIEVNYVLNDPAGVRAKLYEEAVRIIKQKEASYDRSFGIKLTPTSLANEKYDAFYPSELYSGYRAFESGTTSGDYNRVVIRQRKTRTLFYEPLEASSFDAVINQMGLEPMVQFTLYLRLQYDLKK